MVVKVVKVVEGNEFVIIHVDVEGVITPEELPQLIEKLIEEVGNKYMGKGVIISGRMPVWAHSAIAHEFHPCRWVAHFDPRIGAVVVESHTPQVKVGQVIPIEQLKPFL